MRFIGYLLLFVIAFAVTFVWKFPVAGVMPHVNTQPVTIAGVSGTVWSGKAQQVISDNPALVASNVQWRFQPAAIVSGNTAAAVEFEVLGGNGNGNVARHLTSGDVSVTDGTFRMPAANLAQFLPLPIVDFGGNILADIDFLELENNLLTETKGTVIWRDAQVTGGLQAALGQVILDVEPQAGDGVQAHIAKISNADGDLEIDGEMQIDINGNYKADVRLKPTASANQGLAGVLGSLGPIAQRESDGSYRIRNSGNIRNLM
jgi:hypothetical protein